MSIVQQKIGLRSERRMTSTAVFRIKSGYYVHPPDSD
jgi:hypothetical protein